MDKGSQNLWEKKQISTKKHNSWPDLSHVMKYGTVQRKDVYFDLQELICVKYFVCPQALTSQEQTTLSGQEQETSKFHGKGLLI